MEPSAKRFGVGVFKRALSKAVPRQMAPVAYCVKCKAKREMKDPQSITMKNGKKAQQGTCPVCGTKLFRIGG